MKIYQFTDTEDATFFYGEIWAKSFLAVIDSRVGFKKIKKVAYDYENEEYVTIDDSIEVFTEDIEEVV